MITIDSTRRTFLGVLAGGLISGLVACSPSPATSGAAGPTTNPGASGSSEVVLGADQVAPLVSGIVNKAGKDLKPERLGEGLVPPTNKWFSGLVFGDTAQPVFPLPLTFGVDGKGFAFGLPTVTTTEKNIMGGYAPIIQVGTGSATTWQVTAYDELSVTLTGTAGGQVVGTVVPTHQTKVVHRQVEADLALTSALDQGIGSRIHEHPRVARQRAECSRTSASSRSCCGQRRATPGREYEFADALGTNLSNMADHKLRRRESSCAPSRDVSPVLPSTRNSDLQNGLYNQDRSSTASQGR